MSKKKDSKVFLRKLVALFDWMSAHGGREPSRESKDPIEKDHAGYLYILRLAAES